MFSSCAEYGSVSCHSEFACTKAIGVLGAGDLLSHSTPSAATLGQEASRLAYMQCLRCLQEALLLLRCLLSAATGRIVLEDLTSHPAAQRACLYLMSEPSLLCLQASHHCRHTHDVCEDNSAVRTWASNFDRAQVP